VDVLDFCGDVEDFRGLFYKLDAAYQDMDAVFAANGLATMSIPIQDVHMREGVDGKYLEFFTYKDLPFGLQDTAQASWEYFQGAEKHMAYGNLYEKAAKVRRTLSVVCALGGLTVPKPLCNRILTSRIR
jgi:hypothetical protein